jgi:FixJ family two-component response regulator
VKLYLVKCAIIDTDTFFVESYTKILGRFDLQQVMVFSSLQSFRDFGADSFGWVFIDHLATEEIGFHCIREIRTYNASCFIVGMSLKFDLVLSSQYIISGADDFIIKEYDEGEHFELLANRIFKGHHRQLMS